MDALRYPVSLLFLAGLLFYSRLSCPLLEPEEARYAEIPRQMLLKGSWLVPVLHGEDYLQKPPLLYWLIMLSYKLFGVHDWAARLVPCTAAMLTILIAYLWGRRTIGARAGFAGALILSLSGQFLYLGGMVTMDSVLCLWVVAGLACGHVALLRLPARGFNPFGVSINDDREPRVRCATLGYGMQPLRGKTPCQTLLGIPGETEALATQSAERRSSSPERCLSSAESQLSALNAWWLLSALCCGMGIMTKGPVAAVLILVPIVGWLFLDKRARLVGPGLWFVYSGIVLLIAAPWFAAISLRDPEATGAFFWLHNVIRYVTPFDHEKPVWFYLPGILLGMVPWSLLIVPLSVYLFRRRGRWLRRRPPRLGMFAVASLCCLAFFSISGCKRTAYILPVYPCLALALGSFLAQAFRRPYRVKRTWLVLGGMTACVLVATSFVLLPGYHRKFALRDDMAAYLNVPGDISVVCYPRRWDSVSFYLGREVACFPMIERDRLISQMGRSATLLLMKNEAALADLISALPANLEFVACAREGGNIRAGLIKPKAR